MLFEVHGGLSLGDDYADLLFRAKLLQFGGNRSQIAVAGQDKGGIKFVRYGIGKQGDGDIYIGFFLLMRLIPPRA